LIHSHTCLWETISLRAQCVKVSNSAHSVGNVNTIHSCSFTHSLQYSSTERWCHA
jgi:hypothetical protein